MMTDSRINLPLADLSGDETARLMAWIPELELITSHEARERCLRVWAAAWRVGNWPDPEQAPTLPDVAVGAGANLIGHTGRVMQACRGVALALVPGAGPVDLNLLLESAALHDVAKLVEYEPAPEGFRLSEIGRSVHHAAIGAQWALMAGSPPPVARAIYAHTPQVRAAPDTIEAVILFAVDQIDADAIWLTSGHSASIKRALLGG